MPPNVPVQNQQSQPPKDAMGGNFDNGANEQQFIPPNNATTTTPTTTPEQKNNPQQGPKKPNSTQNSLLIAKIQGGMVIMNDGSFRAVVACKSINFDLMSSREREGVEFSYQNFLNALYFPVQIFIRSQRVDIGPYLDKLSDIRRDTDNMLLNVLMDDYINFVDALAEEANIMDKSFFVIIPYSPAGDMNAVVAHGKGWLDKLFGGVKVDNTVTKIDEVTFNKARDEIKNRVESVINGLMQVGVQATQLNTKQVGELYYNVYNPDTAVREPLVDFTEITSTYIRKAPGNGQSANITNGAQNG